MRRLALAFLAATLLFTGCANQKVQQDLTAFKAAAPRSILVVPVANRALDVDAPNYLLSTLSVPLAEKGYYVFPVNTTKVVLEQEGFYEGDQIQKQAPQHLTQMFSADAVLFVTINRWDAQYVLLTTKVTVDLEYQMYAKDGTPIWKASQKMDVPQNNSTGNPIADLVVMAVNAAVTRAAPNYMPLARQANTQVFILGPNAVPNGPYAVTKQ